MPRKRIHSDTATKQAAYRSRIAEATMSEQERITARMKRIHRGLKRQAREGDPLAKVWAGSNVTDTFERMIAYFALQAMEGKGIITDYDERMEFMETFAQPMPPERAQ